MNEQPQTPKQDSAAKRKAGGLGKLAMARDFVQRHPPLLERVSDKDIEELFQNPKAETFETLAHERAETAAHKKRQTAMEIARYEELANKIEALQAQENEESAILIAQLREKIQLHETPAPGTARRAKLVVSPEELQELQRLQDTVDTAKLGLGSDKVTRGGELKEPLSVASTHASETSFEGIKDSPKSDPAMFRLEDLKKTTELQSETFSPDSQKFDAWPSEIVGMGREREVYVDPLHPERMQKKLREGKSETVNQVKAKFYLTKVLHTLFPNTIPDIHRASAAPNIVTVERKDLGEDHRLVNDEILQYEQERDISDEFRKAALEATQRISSDPRTSAFVREINDLGITVDDAAVNFGFDPQGNLVYVDTFDPWERTKGGTLFRGYDPEALERAISLQKDPQQREIALRNLRRLEEIFEEERTATPLPKAA